MTAAKIGIRNHAMFHDIEVAMQRFTRLGIDPHQSRRLALYAALRLTEVFTDREAWEAVDGILGTQPQPIVERESTT